MLSYELSLPQHRIYSLSCTPKGRKETKEDENTSENKASPCKSTCAARTHRIYTYLRSIQLCQLHSCPLFPHAILRRLCCPNRPVNQSAAPHGPSSTFSLPQRRHRLPKRPFLAPSTHPNHLGLRRKRLHHPNQVRLRQSRTTVSNDPTSWHRTPPNH